MLIFLLLRILKPDWKPHTSRLFWMEKDINCGN